MAIGGFNSVSLDNNVPFNNDPGQTLLDGDMLYWNSIFQAFQARTPEAIPKNITDLSNDAGYVSEAKVIELLAGLDTNGAIDLSTYVTEQELSNALIGFSKFSGSYNDLVDKPALPAVDSIATKTYVSSEISKIVLFSGKYSDLLNKPKLFSGNYADLVNRPILFSGDYNDLSNRPNIDLLATKAGVAATIAETVDTAIATALTGGTIDLSSYITESELNSVLTNYQPAFNLAAYALKSEVFSGNYNDLINKPIIFSGDYNDLRNKPYHFSGSYYDLLDAPVLFSGSYIDLKHKPVIPDLSGYAKTSWVIQQLSNINLEGIDLNTFVTETELSTALQGYLQSADFDQYALKTELFSGNYNDLSNKPEIPDFSSYATDQDITSAISAFNSTLNLTQYATQTDIQTAVSNIPIFSGNYNDLINKPGLFDGNYLNLTNRPVLFSGAYNDLTGKPDLTTYATRTYVTEQVALAISGGTINLDGYVTDAQLANALGGIQHPTNISAFTNDAGYVTTNELTTTLQNYQPSIDLSNYYTKSSVDDLINNVSVDLTNYYTISQVNTLLENIDTGTGTVDLSNYSTTTQINALVANSLTSYYTSSQVDNLLANIDTGNINLSDYYTISQVDTTLNNYYNITQVDNLISNAVLQAAGISGIDDLEDVAIGGLPAVGSSSIYSLAYNPVTELWESKNFSSVFATPEYVTQQIASSVSGGSINLDGYATTNYVNQKLLEQGNHFSGNYYDLVNRPEIFNGNYNDLNNKPVLKQYTLRNVGTKLNLVETLGTPETIVSSVDFKDLGIGFSGNYADLSNKPILFSGNYTDLSNKPYIPSIAGLATENYVDDRWSEPVVTGSRTFTHDIVFEDFVQQKTSTVNVDAIKRSSVLAVQTTNNIETEVLNANGTRIDIPLNSTAMFKATIVSSSGVNKSAIVISGVIDNTGGNLAVIGNNIEETISDSEQGWTANLTADTTNNSLKVTVTGSFATVVDWTVFVDISEVIR